ncbi:vertnin [Erpetoichthys calabaricus]|uniref:Vertnin n=1 Tax=Erpetoichthys calabaricus TaxID=27687 RepID=A0A8C4T716_ERPCA|nr:vertnin [Erpetoichthys calabaricus]XP_028677645.1 vertnin [Erpetoichthys calabaricus]
MIQRLEVVQSVLGDLQEATECTGLKKLVGVARDAETALSLFHLPEGHGQSIPERIDVDPVAKSLYPEDAPSDMLPLACKGDGNLLFDVASILLVGNTSLSLELRVRTVVEMLLRKHYYLNGMIDSKVMLQAAKFSLCTEESAEKMNLPMAVLEAIFDADVKATCFPGTYANMWHIYALASVLQCNIYSIYPMYNLKIRPYFNRLIRPRSRPPDSCMATLHIMWSGELQSQSVFKPQHFLPVVQIGMLHTEGEDQGCASPLKTLELLSQDPQISYSSLKDRYNITKSTFYRWKRQTQEHRKKSATRYEAKHFLQMCFLEGNLLPLNQFKEFFPEISRSTYYAWKHELLQMGDSVVPVSGKHLDELEPEDYSPQGKDSPNVQVNQSQQNIQLMVGEKLAGDRAQNFAYMQEAKRRLQQCIAMNNLLPYRHFKKSFPGISRSTYYNWRREALLANPGFKDALGSSEDSLDAEKMPIPNGQTSTAAILGSSSPVCDFTPRRRVETNSHMLSNERKMMRDRAKKFVRQLNVSFSTFRVKFPSISPSFFWLWKKSSATKTSNKSLDWSLGLGLSLLSPSPLCEPSMTDNRALAPLSKGNGQLTKSPLSPYNATISSTYSFPEECADEQVFLMDVVALANFKAKAKLFLQQRFEEKAFPTFKEFRSYFPLTPRSTFYMWKRALHHGLSLVHA